MRFLQVKDIHTSNLPRSWISVYQELLLWVHACTYTNVLSAICGCTVHTWPFEYSVGRMTYLPHAINITQGLITWLRNHCMNIISYFPSEVASWGRLPTTSRGSRWSKLSRGGHIKRSRTTTYQTMAQVESAKRNSPLPLLYIPASSSPNYETPQLFQSWAPLCPQCSNWSQTLIT